MRSMILALAVVLAGVVAPKCPELEPALVHFPPNGDGEINVTLPDGSEACALAVPSSEPAQCVSTRKL